MRRDNSCYMGWREFPVQITIKGGKMSSHHSRKTSSPFSLQRSQWGFTQCRPPSSVPCLAVAPLSQRLWVFHQQKPACCWHNSRKKKVTQLPVLLRKSVSPGWSRGVRVSQRTESGGEVTKECCSTPLITTWTP